MKKIFFLFLFVLFSSNLYAWDGAEGTVQRVWVNGWVGKPLDFSFELKRDDGTTVLLGVIAAAPEANKNRFFTILITAQTSGARVKVFWHPDRGLGPMAEIGNDTRETFGVESISLIP